MSYNIMLSYILISDTCLMHRAVLAHTRGKELPEVGVENFECLPGKGLFATLTGLKVHILLA